jgi:ATP-dependent RNA helicase RhlE
VVLPLFLWLNLYTARWWKRITLNLRLFRHRQFHICWKKDLIGIAQTGTGKTAAFALPILHRLFTQPAKRVPQRPRALVLAPTRELAVQIGESFAVYGKHLPLRSTVVFGGVGYGNQVRDLKSGVDILVATPGRLLDLIQHRDVYLDKVEVFVLDEVDRMLDMGFIIAVKRIVGKLPSERQSVIFSATLPPAIEELATSFLNQPVRVAVTPVATTVEKIEQKICHVDRADKYALLQHLLEKHAADDLALIFVQTKHGANRLAERLTRDGVRADAIHGNKSQGARQRALQDFREGAIRVLVATDIVARGIDVKGIKLVINFDLPQEPDSYVHRIGRTARAGMEGLAITLCDLSERGDLRDIQRLIRMTIPIMQDYPFAAPISELAANNTDYRPSQRHNPKQRVVSSFSGTSKRFSLQTPKRGFGRSRRRK